MLTDLLLKYFFRVEKDRVVFLGSKTQKGSMIAILKSKSLWNQESKLNKLKSIFKFKWTPTKKILQSNAKAAFMDDIFGTPKDYAEELCRLMAWHNSRDWSLDQLTELDIEKSEGLDGMSIMTRLRHRELSSFSLNLNLGERTPLMCGLVYPMVVKIPVISLRYCLDIHSAYAFNEIRKANHPQADSIIAYLYEVLFIQHKIAISLHEYIRLLNYTETQKKESLFINSELNAIMTADTVFSYLKASIEKIIVVLGLIYGITNLDSKKTHKAKLDTLNKNIPQSVTKSYYYELIAEFISSENLDELNSYRSGLLHKKGISDLQPHTYIGKTKESESLRKVFLVLIEQHSKNTAVLIGVLALLTDSLVTLDPPSVSIEEILNATLFATTPKKE